MASDKKTEAEIERAKGSIDISHVHSSIVENPRERKVRKLFRADSDVSDTKKVPHRSFFKELKRQNSAGEVLGVILNRSRDSINCLFHRKLLSSSRRPSQSHVVENHSSSRDNIADSHVEIGRRQGFSTSTPKHRGSFSSIINNDYLDEEIHDKNEKDSMCQAPTKLKVPLIKPPLSPTSGFIKTENFQHRLRTLNENRSKSNGLQIMRSRHHSIDFPVSSITIHSPSRALPYSSVTSQLEYKCNITHILDYLYLSSIKGAYNESELCKCNIQALIDIANVPANFPIPGRTLDCPCFCIEKSHFRSKLYIAVDDIEWENMEQYFVEINNFIEGARKCNKSVLVFSYHGKSRAAAAVVQYLMNQFGLSLDKAYRIIKERRPSIAINPGLWRALKRLDEKIIQNDSGMKNITLNQCKAATTPPKVKDAWLQ